MHETPLGPPVDPWLGTYLLIRFKHGLELCHGDTGTSVADYNIDSQVPWNG